MGEHDGRRRTRRAVARRAVVSTTCGGGRERGGHHQERDAAHDERLVGVCTRAPRVATNVIRSAACPVRSYLHTPIGSRHSGPRPQRRGRSRSGKSPGQGRSGPGPARAGAWRACPWRTTRSRAQRGGAQAGPRPQATSARWGDGRWTRRLRRGRPTPRGHCGASGAHRLGSPVAHPARHMSRARQNRRVGAPVDCRTPLRKRRLPGTRTDRPFPRPARLWHALPEPGDDQAGQRAVGRKDSQG